MTWPLVPLGEVLTHRKEFILIDDLQPYKRCRVQLHAQGVVLRDAVSGAEIKTKRQQVCRPGEFLVAEIDAKLGGFGIVPPELDGAVVSSHYFLFGVDEAHLERQFLDYYIRTPRFREQVAAQGSTNYAAIRPGHVLEYTIPLPPLAEQRRIVARVDAIATRVAAARQLREEVSADADRLLVQMAHRADLSDDAKREAGWRQVALAEVLTQTSDAVPVDTSKEYPNFGIYSFARGLFEKPPISGLETSATTLHRARAGQFIYSRLFAFEGSYGWVTPEFDGQFVSAEYPMFDCQPGAVRAEFLAAYFKAKRVWAAVALGSKGLGDRRQRVQPPQLLAHRVWLPPMPWQDRLAATWAKLDALDSHQAAVGAELDALLPSVLNRAFAGRL